MRQAAGLLSSHSCLAAHFVFLDVLVHDSGHTEPCFVYLNEALWWTFAQNLEHRVSAIQSSQRVNSVSIDIRIFASAALFQTVPVRSCLSLYVFSLRRDRKR